MLYAMNKWKKMVIICLWPYAMRQANNVTNVTPRKGEELSLPEKFSGVQVSPKLHHFHAFMCPMYVLDNALQSGQGAPKWKNCSRLGVYLGPSLNHARSVLLILKPCMGHVTPQFHIKFDDFFETVQDKSTDLDAPDPEWKYLSSPVVRKGPSKSGAKGVLDGLLTPCRETTMVTTMPSMSTRLDHSTHPQQDLPMPLGNDDNEFNHPTQPQPISQTTLQLAQPHLELLLMAISQTCCSRASKNTPRYDQSISQWSQGLVAWELLLDQDEQENEPTATSQLAMQKALEDPIAYVATNNPDILYWDQAMKAHDRDKFIEAIRIELDSHERMGNYKPIPIDKVHNGTKLLDMVWSMQEKCRIKMQEVYKWKVCLNMHRGQQDWQTVRFFLILFIFLGWHSCQLDFVMAYLASAGEMPLYLCLPQGYR